MPRTGSFPAAAALGPVKNTSAAAVGSKSPTLFNAIITRAASQSQFSPPTSLQNNLKPSAASKSPTSTPLPPPAATVPHKPRKEADATSSFGTDATTLPHLATKSTDAPGRHHGEDTAAPSAATSQSDLLKCCDSNSKTAASDSTPTTTSAALETNKSNLPYKIKGAAPAYDGLAFPANSSLEKSEAKSTGPAQPTKNTRPKTGKTLTPHH